MGRSQQQPGRIGLPQNVNGVAPLATFALLASTGSVLQPVDRVGLGYSFNLSTPWERLGIETVTEIRGQTVPIGQKPRLHALNHQVYILVVGVVRLVPAVVSRQVMPWSRAVRERAFTVDQQDDELCFVA